MTFELPASFAQELLWLTHRAAPSSAAYNVPRTLLLEGSLDDAALQRAFDALVERHEILRTTYGAHGDDVVQIIHPPQPVAIRRVDLRSLPETDRRPEARRIAGEGARAPFDLANQPPLRVTLIALADREHILQIASHHIASDGWSGTILLDELSTLYDAAVRSTEPMLPELTVQFGDYAAWEREHLDAASLAYWREALRDANPNVPLPTDFPRTALPGSEAVSASVRLTAAESDAVRALARQFDATTYMALLASYQALLHRYTNAADILVGSPIAGRANPDTHALIGCFATTVVQRARFAPAIAFADLLRAVRTTSLDAFDHQSIPFERLVLELRGRARATSEPLITTVFTMLESAGDAPLAIGDLRASPFATDDDTTKFDLTLFAAEGADGIRLTLRGRADLYRAATLERMLGGLRRLALDAAADPQRRVAELTLLDNDEAAAFAAWNATATAPPTASVATLIARAEGAEPARIAVRCGDDVLTYAELSTASNRLSRTLMRRGIAPGTTVGILLERSVDFVVALVAVLKAGAAYVPLDPEAPPARSASHLREARAALVVTLEAHAPASGDWPELVVLDRDARAIAAESDDPLPTCAANDDVAYVLFTSGSTGIPKGVAVTHGNLANYVAGIARIVGDRPNLVYGMVSTPAADLGNTVLFPALCSGSTLVLFTADDARDATRFAAAVHAHPIDVLKITPAHLRALLDGAPGGPSLLPRRWLVLGGERCPWGLVETVQDAALAPRILNHYGPTETTVGASTFEVTAASAREARALGAQTVPIGKPLPNVQLDVLDDAGQLVPVGVPGELFVSGAGVAAGYVNRPELTATRFITLADGRRAYRTGDRVRRLATGDLVFLGRTDSQVKIRGFRVELGEIEAALARHRSVAQSAVITTPVDDDERIVAFVVPQRDAKRATLGDELRADLRQSLPDYMLPSSFVLLDALPITSNGKLDRSALPTPDGADVVSAYEEPATPTERAIAAIWSEVLGRERVGATDDFFDAGGHSLLAIRVLGKISRTFGVRLPLRALFDTPTLRALADVLDAEIALTAIERMSEEEATAVLAAHGVHD